MFQYVIPALIGLFTGILSWFAANFVGWSLVRFYRLRDEIHTALIRYANVSPVYERKNPSEHPDWAHYLEAHDTLRRLASELRALASNHPVITRLLAGFGHRPGDAASGLFGFANTFADPAARRRGELAWNRDAIERALKFPLTYPEGVKVRDD